MLRTTSGSREVNWVVGLIHIISKFSRQRTCTICVSELCLVAVVALSLESDFKSLNSDYEVGVPYSPHIPRGSFT